MRPLSLHPWRVSFSQAVAIQQSLRSQVRLKPLEGPVRLVAGADVAYSRPTHRMYAAVVVVRVPSLEVVETATASRRAAFPYIPGLFSFRELPPLIAAFRRLHSEPNLILFDGQGLAHPRRFGLACHAGVILDMPTVGCAKSRLIGEHGRVGPARGAIAELIVEGETVGAALRTRRGVRPIYVSPGHLMDLESALRVVLATTGRFRVPEPIRFAHRATTEMRRRLDPRVPTPAARDYPGFLAE